jgi:hypothetical protein
MKRSRAAPASSKVSSFPVAVREHREVRQPDFAMECGDGAFGHRAQQQRLYLRARAAHLVEEEYGEVFAVARQRARFDARRAFAGNVSVVEQVARHHVDGALDALVRAADRTRERAQDGGLADAHVALQQHVPAGEHRNIDEAYRTRHADRRLADLGLHFQGERAPGVQQGIAIHPRVSAAL